jgi:hypothetical protein
MSGSGPGTIKTISDISGYCFIVLNKVSDQVIIFTEG